MTAAATLKVRIGIPHFFRETEGGSGYGSGRPGQRLARCLALGRCLGSLLSLRRSPSDALLHIGGQRINHLSNNRGVQQRLDRIEIELHVFTDGQHRLEDALALHAGLIQLHNVQLENPRHLPLATRNWLIQQEPKADLTLYLEDDLVIADPLFLDKQHWFLNRTGEQLVLMPHRFEPIASGPHARLMVDGPLHPEFIGRFCTPQANVVRGRFDPQGDEISFDITDNPHSGCFVLGPRQIDHLRQQELPNDGFVSPLETAATLTVLQHFPVLKSAAPHQGFLTVEHGHPSFLSYLQTFPHHP